ncbi:MAG: hypothetical protein QHI48_12060 [Bacteroidota bacterium]|nr:hypothetical protein [Bacteroidota bacterium]
MDSTSAPLSAQFSFDQLVSEVNAIVEDLRWLHLELTLRNRCHEALFHGAVTEEDIIRSAFGDLRRKIGALELSIYLKEGLSYRAGLRDLDPSVPWSDDPVPWTAEALRWFTTKPQGSSSQGSVLHYTVNNAHVTAITIPVTVSRLNIASILLVTPTSQAIPRLKKFLTGLAGSLALSLEYVRSGGSDGTAHRTPTEAPPPQSGEDRSEFAGNQRVSGTCTTVEREGSPYPREEETLSDEAVDGTAHFRLSKQYRFMIKYVPFPVVHLDAVTGCIRNANPAFEAVIGTRAWEDVPLSDLATLTEYPGVGDVKPCTLSVITPNGITITYRGIATMLVLFGKPVREIKIDPLETQV